jgi:hypothetical protein
MQWGETPIDVCSFLHQSQPLSNFTYQGNIMRNHGKVAGAREDDVTGMIESDVANSVHGLFERGTRLNGGCSDIENGRQETRFSVCGTVGCTVVADGRFFRGRSATA